MALIRTLPLAVLTCLYAVPIFCQGTVQDQLKSAYRGKTLLLRNFYSGSDLRYDQSGSLVNGGTSGSWTLAAIEITSVVLRQQEIEIAGNRMGTSLLGDKRKFLRTGKIKIHVDRPSAMTEAETSLESVLEKIFMNPREDLRTILPEYWNPYLSGTDLVSRKSAWQRIVALGSPGTRPSGTAPKPMNAPDPKYTTEAASKGTEGRVTLMTIVDASGNPTRIGIVQALGMGLDEEAVATLGQWKFHPSMLNGQPIAVPAVIEMNFKCCP